MTLPTEVGQIGVEILNAARRWAAARNQIRRMIDSKSASESDVKKATNIYNKAADELELKVRHLEKLLLMNGQIVPMARGKGKGDFPWKSFLKFVAEGVKAVEQAVNEKPPPTPIEAEVIDVEGTSK